VQGAYIYRVVVAWVSHTGIGDIFLHETLKMVITEFLLLSSNNGPQVQSSNTVLQYFNFFMCRINLLMAWVFSGQTCYKFLCECHSTKHLCNYLWF
jgi:hypothetical protein